MSDRQTVLLISILSLGRPTNVLKQLENLPVWLADLGMQLGIASHIVVRNNDPNVVFDAVAVRMSEIGLAHPGISCTLVSDVPNNGFGEGHNGNIASESSDYILILNDDIGFPHMNWLAQAIQVLESDRRIACVAAEENPKHINPTFGNGLLPTDFHMHTITYAEASILLFDRQIFEQAGGFSADFAWAMCEDADLSLRIQQLGYRLVHLAMPHEHWRSTSFNSLPSPVKSSILEHNRAALFANWRDTLTTGIVGRYEVFDLWSDGLGDVLCALPHLLARLAPLSAERRANVVINTSSLALLDILNLDDVRVMSVQDLGQLRAELRDGGIASLRSTREVNFSLPFNIHPLLVGALGIEYGARKGFATLGTRLRELKLPARAELLIPGQYCVIHLEFERNHEGRALHPAECATLLQLCGQLFDTVVLVGRAAAFSTKLFGEGPAKIVDLQGALSLGQLAAVIAQAQYFVGIDSFPSHVAQASGVASAIFYGAVHPLTRVWNQAVVWPIVASLDCIGCYHTHLEPSLPFCMRRDQACTTDLSATNQRAVLEAMVRREPFNWSAHHLRLQELQARLLKLACHHPAPPERLFRGQRPGNEQVSNFIYRMTNQMGELLRDQYQTSTVNALTARAQELQANLYSSKVELEEMRRRLQQRRVMTPGEFGSTAHLSKILQLSTLQLTTARCRTSVAHPWIEVEAFEDDPQLLLPLIQGLGAKVQLRLSCIAETNENVQIYWAQGEESFSLDRLRLITPDASPETSNVIFDLGMGEILRVRIDPTRGIGRSRLLGSIRGVFTLLDGHASPDGALDVALPAVLASRDGLDGAVHVETHVETSEPVRVSSARNGNALGENPGPHQVRRRQRSS